MMDNPNTTNAVEKNFSLDEAGRLQPTFLAVLYAVLALGNFLLYGPTSFAVLGFTDEPIGWWVMIAIPFMIAFLSLALRLARQTHLAGTNPHQQLQSRKRLIAMLSVLAILFAVPNVLLAFLHLSIGIPSGFLYWGQARAAYKIPIFHLLPILLLLYWWLSSWGRTQAVPAPYRRLFMKRKGRSEGIDASLPEKVVDMKTTLTDWCHMGMLSLGGYFVLAYLIVSILRPHVSHSVNGGMTVVTDFTALYFFGISGSVLLGLLFAIGSVVYWRRRLYLMVDADYFFITKAGFIRFTVWWLPLLIAVVGVLVVGFLSATNL